MIASSALSKPTSRTAPPKLLTGEGTATLDSWSIKSSRGRKISIPPRVRIAPRAPARSNSDHFGHVQQFSLSSLTRALEDARGGDGSGLVRLTCSYLQREEMALPQPHRSERLLNYVDTV